VKFPPGVGEGAGRSRVRRFKSHQGQNLFSK